MTRCGLRYRPLAFFLLLFSVAARAGGDAHTWLLKMNQASRDLSYSGSFVYQHGDQLESMRILRKVQGGLVRERLMSLNGAAREVIRTDQEVRCYLPDENMVVVEQRRLEARSFPSLLPQSLHTLDKNYLITLGDSERVVDRNAQSVTISPRDSYRYGYRLWADKETGLLLKANLVDHKGLTIEQFMFTSIDFDGRIADSAFEPSTPGKNSAWYREGKDTIQPLNANGAWTVGRLPPGFTLSMHMRRMIPRRKAAVEHLIYSDGLAVVSVFIEKVTDKSAPDDFTDSAHIGAVHTRARVIDAHRVTVVGEVPAATVDMMGESVAPPQ